MGKWRNGSTHAELDGISCQLHVPAAWPPVSIEQEAGWVPEPVVTLPDPPENES
jgi:hypothetical protein